MTNGHSKVSYPPDWWDPSRQTTMTFTGKLDPDPLTVDDDDVGDAWPEWSDKAYGYKPVVSRGVQRWVLLACFALGLGIGLVLGWRWG